MRVNYKTNEEGIIVSYQSFPLNEDLPIIDVPRIITGFSCIKDGLFCLNEEAFELNTLRKVELNAILKWFSDNDWKINKILLGEWTEDDERWKEYIETRKKYRARHDELVKLIV